MHTTLYKWPTLDLCRHFLLFVSPSLTCPEKFTGLETTLFKLYMQVFKLVYLDHLLTYFSSCVGMNTRFV